ncbi:biotin/lipoyl-binding protein [Noviherbaspirillum sp. 1P10PC]|uniref:biotin/lipoyl-binding protein n=1 Tax=Noviherbaspirillum sp. 1P10PC TaxID=3132292 RepID=UPI0039A19EF5
MQVQRHVHRGQVWHQLADEGSGRRQRLNQEAWRFVGCFDGRLTVGAVWDALLKRDGDAALSQDEAIRVLEQLSNAELLQCELPPDIEAQFRRKKARQTRQRWLALNPLSVRVRLFDPSRLLDRCAPFLPRLFSRAAFAAWLGLVLVTLLALPRYWPELQAFAHSHADTPRYLIISCLVYPLIKALHEAGHALAVRRWGGEVHHVGFTAFLFMPVPYVDASAASGFPRRAQRALVSAIGIMVELLLAALAFHVWTEVPLGLVKDIAFVTMLTAGLSTLAVNGNPLLRFDGYFLMCDLFDLPNLEQRSNAWWSGMAQRLVSGVQEVTLSPAVGERKWLVLYTPLAWFYRFTLGTQAMLWAAGKSALLGLLLAAAFAAAMLASPLRGAASMGLQLLRDDTRPRARLALCLSAVALLLAFVCLPLPYGATAPGVVWLPEQAQVRAGTGGRVREMRVNDGMHVERGQVLAVLEDSDLLSAREEAVSRLSALLADQYGALRNSRAQAVSLESAVAHAHAEIERLDQRISQLEIRSEASGRMVLMRQADLPGSFIKKGGLLGYVLPSGPPVLRALVSDGDAALVRERSRGASVWLDDSPGKIYPARLLRDIPAATVELPSGAFADSNGGPIATDPADTNHLRALEPFFQFDLALPDAAFHRALGRARVRFDFGHAPLASQLAHSLRQLAIRHLGTGR